MNDNTDHASALQAIADARKALREQQNLQRRIENHAAHDQDRLDTAVHRALQIGVPLHRVASRADLEINELERQVKARNPSTLQEVWEMIQTLLVVLFVPLGALALLAIVIQGLVRTPDSFSVPMVCLMAMATAAYLWYKREALAAAAPGDRAGYIYFPALLLLVLARVAYG